MKFRVQINKIPLVVTTWPQLQEMSLFRAIQSKFSSVLSRNLREYVRYDKTTLQVFKRLKTGLK
jgi:hypothetical protein